MKIKQAKDFKISVNFMELWKARPMLNRRRCWQTCFECNMLWSGITTIHVHMVGIMTERGHETRFICDDCLKSIENEK